MLRLPESTTSALRVAARRIGVTLNSVLQTAWALLLARYAGRDEVLSDSTRTTRPAELDGSEDTVGLFVNTLPLRVFLSPDAEFAACCEDLRRRHAALRRFVGPGPPGGLAGPVPEPRPRAGRPGPAAGSPDDA